MTDDSRVLIITTEELNERIANIVARYPKLATFEKDCCSSWCSSNSDDLSPEEHWAFQDLETWLWLMGEAK